MAEERRFFFPGGDGKWDNPALPETLETALDRIKVLEAALGYYSDCRSYDPDSQDNEYPAHDELLADKGMSARIGRAATTPDEYRDWLSWALPQDRRY